VRVRVVLGVSIAWLLIGVVLGSQTALGLSLQGEPIPLAGAVRTQLVNSLPWIPATLIAIALAARFSLTRETWTRTIWIHLAAIPVVAWVANVGVVAGFWWINGMFNGWGVLAERAVFWGTVRIHVAVTVYGVSVLLTHAWIYVREARARELTFARMEGQLAQARFRALNEQIRPHFLFNTLHTIGHLWRSGRADDADTMLDHLGSLFQRVNSSTDRARIPLEEELSMVGEYLAIEQTRFSDRLVTRIEATSEARSCMIPPLLLQPLVENAIRHGISTTPTAGVVSISAAVEPGQRLVVHVQDDGPGMENPTPYPGSGTGLSNTRERLEHAWGDDQSMQVREADGGGTDVRLELPAVFDTGDAQEGGGTFDD